MKILNFLRNMQCLMLCLTIILKITSLNSQALGTVITDSTGYSQMEIGNINILITSPHGGYLEPSNIMNRTSLTISGNRAVTTPDGNTLNTSRIITDELSALFKRKYGADIRPYYIHTKLRR